MIAAVDLDLGDPGIASISLYCESLKPSNMISGLLGCISALARKTLCYNLIYMRDMSSNVFFYTAPK